MSLHVPLDLTGYPRRSSRNCGRYGNARETKDRSPPDYLLREELFAVVAFATDLFAVDFLAVVAFGVDLFAVDFLAVVAFGADVLVTGRRPVLFRSAEGYIVGVLATG